MYEVKLSDTAPNDEVTCDIVIGTAQAASAAAGEGATKVADWQLFVVEVEGVCV